MDIGVRVSVEVAMTSPALQAMDGTIAKVDYTLPGINKPPSLHQVLLGVRTAMKAVQEQIGENGVGLRLARLSDHGFADTRDLHWQYGDPLGACAVCLGGEELVFYGTRELCHDVAVEPLKDPVASRLAVLGDVKVKVVNVDQWLAEQEAVEKA